VFSVAVSEMACLPFLVVGAIRESLDLDTGRLEAAVFKRGRSGGDHRIGSLAIIGGSVTPMTVLIRGPRAMV